MSSLSLPQGTDDAPPRESHAAPRHLPSIVGWMHFLGRRTLLALLVSIFGSLGLGFVELVIALFLQLFLQRIGVVTQPVQLPGPLRGYSLTSAGLVGGLMAIALARGLAQFLVSWGAVIAFETTNARLRRLAVYEMLLCPGQRYIPAALVHARVGEIFPKAAWACFFCATFLASSAQGFVLGAIMTAAAWRESLIALTGLAAVGVIVLQINRRTRKVGARVPREQGVLTEGIERVARNLLLVRALRTESYEHRRFAGSIRAYAVHSAMASTLTAVAVALTPLLALFLLVGIILVSQRFMHTPGLVLLSFLYLFIRFAQTLAQVVQSFSQINQYLPQLQDALSYFGTFAPHEIGAAISDAAEALPQRRWGTQEGPVDATDPLGPRLELTAVTYAYPRSSREVLRDVTAVVEPGQQLAVVGPSGVGKSTLLALALGLVRPLRGTITIEGQAPEAYLSNPAVRIGYVGAEAFLIAGTVRENLCYGLARSVDDAEIEFALERSSLRGVVDRLPGRLQYRIGEDGSGLSAGQKQRLCLGRAMLNRPHLLVLDEASANLDNATELQIAESLRTLRGRCTTIIVSHRSGLVKYADHVLELKETPT